MPKLRRGYLSPPVIIVLAIICLFVALSLFLNAQLSRNINKQSNSSQSVLSSPSISPQQDSDETVYTEDSRSVNWKTYTNTVDKFSFKYPPQFTLDEQLSTYYLEGQKTSYYLLVFKLTENGKTGYSSYAVHIKDSPGKTISQEYKGFIDLFSIKAPDNVDEAQKDPKDGIHIYRVKNRFYEFEPTYQDSTSQDKIWNYPILDTLKFTQ